MNPQLLACLRQLFRDREFHSASPERMRKEAELRLCDYLSDSVWWEAWWTVLEEFTCRTCRGAGYGFGGFSALDPTAQKCSSCGGSGRHF